MPVQVPKRGTIGDIVETVLAGHVSFFHVSVRHNNEALHHNSVVAGMFDLLHRREYVFICFF